MDYQSLIRDLKKLGASDLHLEAGLPPTARIQGALKPLGSDPLEGTVIRRIAQELLNDDEWQAFSDRRSFDTSSVIGGVRCRMNIMTTQRGVGMAIRLLSTFQPTLDRLNLHPDLAKLVKRRHGLIVVCGPTGSGKSSTLAALLHEINARDSLHIVTVESPIEYTLLPRRSFIRQREVDRDTPSFERALLDAMRQDPDVIMVGEMRERETIRLTLNAAETGQLVLSTLHSSNTAEAVQRMVSAFPSDIHGAVCGQLADCLVAVVAQRLKFHEGHGIRVPVCEIMMVTNPVRNLIRQGQFFKLQSALETGYGEGSWTFRRYQEWLDGLERVFVPTGTETVDPNPRPEEEPGGLMIPKEGKPAALRRKPGEGLEPVPKPAGEPSEDIIVIEEPDEESLGELLKKLGGSKEAKTSPGAKGKKKGPS